MAGFCHLEFQHVRFALRRALLVQVVLSLFSVSVLGGWPPLVSSLRACCEEGPEEVKLQEETVAVAHRRVRHKSCDSKRRVSVAIQSLHTAPRMSRTITSLTLDRCPPAWFLLGAGIRILC